MRLLYGLSPDRERTHCAHQKFASVPGTSRICGAIFATMLRKFAVNHLACRVLACLQGIAESTFSSTRLVRWREALLCLTSESSKEIFTLKKKALPISTGCCTTCSIRLQYFEEKEFFSYRLQPGTHQVNNRPSPNVRPFLSFPGVFDTVGSSQTPLGFLWPIQQVESASGRRARELADWFSE